MPTTQRGSLSANEVYALTAFLLYKNGIIQESDVMDAKSLPEVRMPNRNNFVPLWPEWKKDAKRPHGIYP
jgi:cytochrome c